MTLQEYLQTPETVLPQELIYGAIRVADAPFVSHQRVVFRLGRALQEHVEDEGAGEILIAPVDVVLDADRALVVQPDLLFVRQDRRDFVLDQVYGPPDIVVEVLSPRPRIGELGERVGWFAEYGVREIWLYHQLRRQLDILACDAGRVTATESFGWTESVRSHVLPSFDRTLDSIVGDDE